MAADSSRDWRRGVHHSPVPNRPMKVCPSGAIEKTKSPEPRAMPGFQRHGASLQQHRRQQHCGRPQRGLGSSGPASGYLVDEALDRPASANRFPASGLRTDALFESPGPARSGCRRTARASSRPGSRCAVRLTAGLPICPAPQAARRAGHRDVPGETCRPCGGRLRVTAPAHPCAARN